MKEEKYKKFEDQFNFSESDYLHQTDFLNWYRHFFVIKEIFDFEPQKILEMGSGNGIVKNSLKSIIGEYKTMDINKELKPDYLSDIRNFNPELKEKFDCVLATDILEHIPYGDMAKSLENIFLYLERGGRAIIAIPHRADYFLFMLPFGSPHVLRMPSKILSPVAIARRISKKSWIDFFHCWEIGVGGIKKKSVEDAMKKVGFKIEKSKTLLYVDFWVLHKNLK